MPELPEVEVLVNELRPRLVGRQIIDVQTDWPKYYQLPKKEAEFRDCVAGRKINAISRRAKYVLIHLSGNRLLLVHQKISGRLLMGRWNVTATGQPHSRWQPAVSSNASPATGRFLHLVFELDNGEQLGLSDLRKFAKVLCGPEKAILNLPEMLNLGPEPLAREFTITDFQRLFIGKRGTLKQVLIDPAFIAGIGNLYSDEILYAAGMHPLSRVERLQTRQLQVLYRCIRTVLRKAVRLGATGSPAADGSRQGYDRVLCVYGREGQRCPRGHVIERIKIAGRSAHFCPVEQSRF